MEERIIGFLPLSNCGGLGVLDFDFEEEKITYGIFTDRLLSKHTKKIYFSNKGAYFIHGNRRMYLSEIERYVRG